MDVDVAVHAGDEAWAEPVEEDAMAMLEALALNTPVLSVVLTDDPGIQALNAQWRGKDAATDVLSFPQQEGDVDGGLLGDLVISLSTAQVQAAEAGHDLRTELRVLMAHGLCHLLGHDHQDEDDTAAMREAEAALLAVFGLASEVGLVERAQDVR